MRAILSFTLATALLFSTGGVFAAKLPASQPAGVPLAAPLGVTHGSIKAALPPGVTAEQVAMAAAAGMTIFRNTEVYADTKGMTLYTYDPTVKLSLESTIGALADNPGTKAVLEKHLPGISTNPALAQARGLTFSAVKQFLPILTDAKLKAMGDDLASVPADRAPATCTGECAKAWPPFLAPANAPPSGLWTIAAREDGARQWIFDGKAVHFHAKDEKPGDAKGNKADGGKWNFAVVKPLLPMPTPPGVRATETMNFDGKVLVDPRGMTLYVSDADKPNVSTCAAACARTWVPLEAPRLAIAIGDFAPISRPDGTKQWAFKARPLYTYAGDAKAGEAKGEGVGGQWRQAMQVRYYFPADVKVQEHPKHGPMLATAKGLTLYARDVHRFTLAGGSHDDRNALRGNFTAGSAIGVMGCTGECLQSFTPLKVSADALPWGDWTIVKRPDESAQWAYRGYPLYTYIDDKNPGDAVAHDLYELSDGTNGTFWRVALP